MGRSRLVVRSFPAAPPGVVRAWLERKAAESRLARPRPITGPRPRGTLVTTVSSLAGRVTVEDEWSPARATLGSARARRRLERWLTYRHRNLAADLTRHLRFANAGTRTVAISGSHGLLGSSLVDFLEAGGHVVRRIVRARQAGAIAWDPATGEIDGTALGGVDAVVHLAGENIAGGRWTPARKERIRRSRVEGTEQIARALALLSVPPRVLVCASAIGFYGDRGEESLDESSAPGRGFLAETCRAWEEASRPAERAGIRVVRLRIGIVLAAEGGALARMIPPFRVGLGGRVGHGRQFMSWVGLDDLVGAIHHALFDEALAGPVNVVAPAPARNAEFARQLGRVLGRPALFPLPAPAVRLVLGEMGVELLLAGARVAPTRLADHGFRFLHPELEAALRFECGRLLPAPGDPEVRFYKEEH